MQQQMSQLNLQTIHLFNCAMSLRRNILNLYERVIHTSTFKRMLCTTNTSNKIFKIQDEKDFEENVIKSEIPVVIDFQASWCGPCKLLEPRLENIIGTRSDKVHLAKIDIDTNTEIAMQYDVQAVPHVLGFKNGQAHKSFIGLKDEDQIASFVDELIEQ